MMWVLVYPALLIPSMFLPALRAAGVRTGVYLEALRPAAEGAAMMALVVGVSHATWLATVRPGVRLWVEVSLGAVAYPAYLLTMHRDQLADYLAWFRALRTRRA